MSREASSSTRAEDLRRAFDRSFAEPPPAAFEQTETFLAVTVGGDSFLISLFEVSSIHATRPLTSVPSSVSELMGIASYRASIVAVYDLGALMGYPPMKAARWLVTLSAETEVALGVDAFDGSMTLPVSRLTSDETRPNRFVHRLAETSTGTRPIVHLQSVLEAIEERAQRVTEQKER